ncbi:hypothetical protein T06_7983 [Trichinella sp. T6]|nr:hypothetical protein T06_7983 [Trichinella sp. T6]
MRVEERRHVLDSALTEDGPNALTEDGPNESAWTVMKNS